MGTRGPLKKPAAQVHGWRKASRIRQELAAKPSESPELSLKPLETLSAPARVIWREAVALSRDAGHPLRATDSSTLATYCELMARYREVAARQPAGDDETKLLIRLSRAITPLLAAMMLSPAARQRAGVPAAREPDALDVFIARKPRPTPPEPLAPKEVERIIKESRAARAARGKP